MGNASSAKAGAALRDASRQGDPVAVQLLLDRRADPNRADPKQAGDTALHIACHQGHLEVARLLLGHRADPNTATTDRHGFTPLYAASANGHAEVARDSHLDLSRAPYVLYVLNIQDLVSLSGTRTAPPCGQVTCHTVTDLSRAPTVMLCRGLNIFLCKYDTIRYDTIQTIRYIQCTTTVHSIVRCSMTSSSCTVVSQGLTQNRLT